HGPFRRSCPRLAHALGQRQQPAQGRMRNHEVDQQCPQIRQASRRLWTWRFARTAVYPPWKASRTFNPAWSGGGVLSMVATRKPRFTLDIEAPTNGKVGKATVVARDADGKTVHTDRANLADDTERRRLVKRMAAKLDVKEDTLLRLVEDKWNELLDE